VLFYRCVPNLARFICVLRVFKGCLLHKFIGRNGQNRQFEPQNHSEWQSFTPMTLPSRLKTVRRNPELSLHRKQSCLLRYLLCVPGGRWANECCLPTAKQPGYLVRVLATFCYVASDERDAFDPVGNQSSDWIARHTGFTRSSSSSSAVWRCEACNLSVPDRHPAKSGRLGREP